MIQVEVTTEDYTLTLATDAPYSPDVLTDMVGRIAPAMDIVVARVRVDGDDEDE